MPAMHNKVVLITGATGGLGTSVTAAFQNAGARVAAVDRALPNALPNKETSPEASERFASFAADLSTLEGARGAVEAVVSRWGQVDVMVHLIGGFAGGQSVADSDDALFDRMINLNLRTAFYMFRATVTPMRAQGHGRLL